MATVYDDRERLMHNVQGCYESILVMFLTHTVYDIRCLAIPRVVHRPVDRIFKKREGLKFDKLLYV